MSSNNMQTLNKPRKRGKIFTIVSIALFTVTAIVLGLATLSANFLFGGGNDAATASSTNIGPTATPSSTPTPTPSPEVCDPQYVQVASNNDEGRVVGDFEQRYAASVTEANNLTDAQRTLLIEESSKDASVLATWAHAFGLFEEPNERDGLVDNGCLSSEGISLHNQLVGALSATGTTFEEVEAPADYYNSGITDGVYGVSDTAGIYGERKAIKVTMRDGTVVYIMVRCGNPVYPGKPNLPTVPTDNPPPPAAPPTGDTPPTVTPPTENEPKNPSLGSYPSGNANTGGGENVNPGRGEETTPTQPPAPPRSNPPAPAPVPPAPQPPTPSNPSPAPVPTPDPAPAPAPEPVAPQPSDPVIEPCIIPPGETTC